MSAMAFACKKEHWILGRASVVDKTYCIIFQAILSHKWCTYKQRLCPKHL